MLNAYLTECALRVQKAFRGFMVRKYFKNFRRALGRYRRGNRLWTKIDKLEAVVEGWRTRKILAMRQVK